MDVQTQVVAPSQLEVMTMQEQDRLAAFKQSLADVRAGRLSLVQQINTVSDSLDNLVGSRSDIISMFKSEALAMYPETSGQDIGNILGTLTMSHPLRLLWDKYVEKLQPLDSSFQLKLIELSDYQNSDKAAEAQENQILNAYAEFRSSAITTLPSPEQLYADLAQVEVMPYVEEDSTIVSLQQIARINREAAAIVALETASHDQFPHDDSGDEDEQTLAQSQVQGSSTDSFEDASDIVQGMTSREFEMQAPLAQPNFKKLGWGLAAVTLYFVFKGKN